MKIKINVVNDNEETSVKDNDLTEYRNSVKPDYIKNPYFFKETHIVGNPPHIGDVLLIKVKDISFKCEIIDGEHFRKSPNLFSLKIYPLDEDVKALFAKNILYRDRKYADGALVFDKEIKHENGDTYWEYDFTKGIFRFFSTIDDLSNLLDEQPFTVVKFLTKSIPASTIQDAGINFDNLETDISEDLNGRFDNLYYNCIDFRYLLEDYEKAIEKIIYNDEPSDEYDEDPKDREYKDYLEKVASCIPDIIYSLKDIEKEIRKR